MSEYQGLKFTTGSPELKRLDYKVASETSEAINETTSHQEHQEQDKEAEEFLQLADRGQ